MDRKITVPDFLLLGGAGVTALLSSFFGLLFYGFYWQHRGLFNSEGRYFDPTAGVVFRDEAFALCIPAVFFLGLTIGLLWLGRRARSRRRIAST